GGLQRRGRAEDARHASHERRRRAREAPLAAGLAERARPRRARGARLSLSQTIPLRTAYTAAWMRLSIWSFIRMFEMWFLTVFGLMWSSAAIIALSLPFAISFSTWISRSESSERIVSASRGDELVARRRWSTFEAIAGETSDSPAAAARMPAISSSIDESLSR